jgi:hypothetical protein
VKRTRPRQGCRAKNGKQMIDEDSMLPYQSSLKCVLRGVNVNSGLKTRPVYHAAWPGMSPGEPPEQTGVNSPKKTRSGGSPSLHPGHPPHLYPRAKVQNR